MLSSSTRLLFKKRAKTKTRRKKEKRKGRMNERKTGRKKERRKIFVMLVHPAIYIARSNIGETILVKFPPNFSCPK